MNLRGMLHLVLSRGLESPEAFGQIWDFESSPFTCIQPLLGILRLLSLLPCSAGPGHDKGIAHLIPALEGFVIAARPHQEWHTGRRRRGTGQLGHIQRLEQDHGSTVPADAQGYVGNVQELDP